MPMPEVELSLALTLLRIVRGWRQDDLAKASGIPNSSISDYERGKKVPALRTLERLLSAMGYSINAVQRTERYVQHLRSQEILERLAQEAAAGLAPEPEDAAIGKASPAALQWELEQISAETGQAVARLTRAVLVMMNRSGRAGPIQEERP